MLNLNRLLYRRLFSAFKGYVIWHSIVHGSKLPDNRAVILIPDPVDEKCARYSVKHLKAFLACNYFQDAIFLSNYPKLEQFIRKYRVEKLVAQIIPLNKKKLDHVIDFYNANLNDSRIVIAALDVPFGRDGSHYLRTGVLSKEELFLISIYNVTEGSEFERFNKEKKQVV